MQLLRGGLPTRLAKEYGAALIKYAEFVGEKPRVTTVADAVSHYLESSATRLKPSTLEGYRISAANLAAVFGTMDLHDLTAAHVYQYLVTRGNVQANRDKALLSAAYTHARNIGSFDGDDPAKRLQFRNREEPRQRYVTDAEQTTLLAAASPKLACIMQFLHLTAMRQGDALRVRLSDLTAEGIAFEAGKTGKRTVVLWSTDLQTCVDDAKQVRAGVFVRVETEREACEARNRAVHT